MEVGEATEAEKPGEVSELNFLRARVKELRTQNASLSHQLANCRCKANEGNHTCGVIEDKSVVEKMKILQLGKKRVNKWKSKEITPGYCTQKSWLAVCKEIRSFEDNVFWKEVEWIFFRGAGSNSRALEKARLINGDRKDCHYSRCGRTDKGVSSVGQVIALYLRSNHKERGGEIDYVKLLNRYLPSDIRVMGWSPAPNDFSARFSCLSRVYKYFFWEKNLNVKAMETAGMKFIGEHDFRNFCKMDAANVHTYKRSVRQFQISCCDERIEGKELWMIKIKGTAFLWHQIRCMVAVLFLICQDLESPLVIDDLLNIERTPRKPQYKMASELPLVLQSCEFEDLNFICSSDAAQALHGHLEEERQNYKIQAAIADEALINFSISENDFSVRDLRSKKKEPCHVPLMSRPTEPSYEERRAKLNSGLGG